MIYLIVLIFNWEPDAIIKLKQLTKEKKKDWREKPYLKKKKFPE